MPTRKDHSGHWVTEFRYRSMVSNSLAPSILKGKGDLGRGMLASWGSDQQASGNAEMLHEPRNACSFAFFQIFFNRDKHNFTLQKSLLAPDGNHVSQGGKDTRAVKTEG